MRINKLQTHILLRLSSLTACLSKLHTLQISHNILTTAGDIEHLAECNEIGVLDLSHNHLDDPQIVDVLAKMKMLVRLLRSKCNNKLTTNGSSDLYSNLLYIIVYFDFFSNKIY